MQILPIAEYTIHIGPVGEALAPLMQQLRYSTLFVLVDEHTELHCLPRIRSLVEDAVVIRIPAGEEAKNIQECQHIWQQLLDGHADRKSLIINLGGGVIGDMGGFCAGTFKRGIPFIQIPTTLLSQVDASVGGKLGIDFKHIKNCIGLFRNPQAVLVDPQFCLTLPDRQLASGMIEIFKHGLLHDVDLYHKLLALESLTEILDEEYIGRAIAVKREVVEQDPYEAGLRKILNLGHTLGHGVESYFLDTDHPLLHGEAVAIGLIGELYIASKRLGFPVEELTRIERFVKRWYPEIAIPDEARGAILQIMAQDKKNERNQLHFSLLKKPGEPYIDCIIEPELVQEAITYYNNQLSVPV
ncbi:MAG TPA: 3-dehydroquinate synthase [Saprospiraceae bacterium]|nr:3-dehydroquinate synthase [Saprospiraceae bacterium]HPG07579.1 3-dehydroquinate synthase [Saprospiraceae bacterium]HRV86057.1 3-dehydroquinate synthase [Saprospiraceae bacterium]